MSATAESVFGNAAPRPRPSRERGRKQLRGMAYQRALADLRDRHRDEFDGLYHLHRKALEREAEAQKAATKPDLGRWYQKGDRVIVRVDRQLIAGTVERVGRVMDAVRLDDGRLKYRHTFDVFAPEDGPEVSP